VYIQQHSLYIEFNSRNKLNRLAIKNEFECAAVECRMYDMSLLIVSIYRPPTGSMKVFLSSIEHFLCSIVSKDKNILLAGDFNIEIFKILGLEVGTVDQGEPFFCGPTTASN